MGDTHDAWFFIGVFIFIFLIWIATGGPLHPIAFTGPTLSGPGPLGGGTYFSLPKAPYGIGNTNTSLSGSSNGGNLGDSKSLPPITINGSVFGSSSIYRGLVSINHTVSNAGAADPNNEYIEIYVAQNAGVPVDLSGWSISSDATGNTASIPKGTETPTSGVVNAAQNIILAPGERAIVISGQSPIGASFRENKCIGYFSSFQKFSPSLPQNCPVPSDDLISFYGPNYIRDVACIEHVNKINRCQVTLTPPANATGACQNFIVKYLNYNGCLDAHKNDTSFKGGVWRIYLGRTSSMWRTRYEIVKLLDANNNIVDAFGY